MKKLWMIILSAVLVLAAAVVLTDALGGFKAPEFRIFADLDELAFLDKYCVGELDDFENITEGLDVVEKKCMEVDYCGSRFCVYAFVFGNESEAKTFFESTKTITDNTGGWHYRACQSDRAFFAFGPSQNSRSFKALLDENFSSIVNHF